MAIFWTMAQRSDVDISFVSIELVPERHRSEPLRSPGIPPAASSAKITGSMGQKLTSAMSIVPLCDIAYWQMRAMDGLYIYLYSKTAPGLPACKSASSSSHSDTSTYSTTVTGMEDSSGPILLPRSGRQKRGRSIQHPRRAKVDSPHRLDGAVRAGRIGPISDMRTSGR